MKGELTDQQHWDTRWEKIVLPSVLDKVSANPLAREIIRTFETYLPRQKGLTILEVGGAPGTFLTYFAREMGYQPHALDYSPIGCEKIKENFRLLGREVTVYQRDFFGDLSDLPKFDLVFSSGFVEHFTDFEGVVQRHLDLVKEGGWLVLGTPNFRGIYRPVLQCLSPQLLAMHHLDNMDIRKWRTVANSFRLQKVFESYLGGFEPSNFRRCENRTLKNQLIRYFFKPIRILITDKFSFLRKFNSELWSAYLLGIYRKSDGQGQ